MHAYSDENHRLKWKFRCKRTIQIHDQTALLISATNNNNNRRTPAVQKHHFTIITFIWCIISADSTRYTWGRVTSLKTEQLITHWCQLRQCTNNTSDYSSYLHNARRQKMSWSTHRLWLWCLHSTIYDWLSSITIFIVQSTTSFHPQRRPAKLYPYPFLSLPPTKSK